MKKLNYLLMSIVLLFSVGEEAFATYTEEEFPAELNEFYGKAAVLPKIFLKIFEIRR